MTSYWREKSNTAIRAALDEGRKQGLDGAELEKFVRANGYPFHVSLNHPYRIWLSELKRVLAVEAGKNPDQPRGDRREASAGQMEMFG